jgi:hypothetical protein
MVEKRTADVSIALRHDRQKQFPRKNDQLKTMLNDPVPMVVVRSLTVPTWESTVGRWAKSPFEDHNYRGLHTFQYRRFLRSSPFKRQAVPSWAEGLSSEKFTCSQHQLTSALSKHKFPKRCTEAWNSRESLSRFGSMSTFTIGERQKVNSPSVVERLQSVASRPIVVLALPRERGLPTGGATGERAVKHASTQQPINP